MRPWNLIPTSDHSDNTEDNFSLLYDHDKWVHKNWKMTRFEDAVSDEHELTIYLCRPVENFNKDSLEI